MIAKYFQVPIKKNWYQAKINKLMDNIYEEVSDDF